MWRLTWFSSFIKTVSEGKTLTIIFNISGENQQADYIYLVKGSPLIRIIKLLKGEDDGGTCYHEIPRCKENYCLRHSEEKTLNITVRDVTESMEGCYRLYPYCLGSNHHCTTDQPLKSFILSVKGKVKWLTVNFHPQKWICLMSGYPGCLLHCFK